MDSDSEDDPDYLPPKENGGASHGSDRETPAPKRARTVEGGPSEGTVNKKTGDDIYAAFKASLSAPASRPPQAPTSSETVKVVKRYRFAGEEITEVQEVPADSEEARKWPMWTPPSDTDVATASHKGDSQQEPISSTLGGAAGPSSSAVDATTLEKPPAKRPGPRKKRKLGDIPDMPKKEPIKRLSTLDKSTMDWRTHVEGAEGSGVKEELDANRRGGGYLEKVEFLQRVETRREDVLDVNKGKRRR